MKLQVFTHQQQLQLQHYEYTMNTLYNKLEKISDLLQELINCNKLQADLLQQLLNNRQRNPDQAIQSVMSILMANPMFAKFGITKETLNNAMKGKG